MRLFLDSNILLSFHFKDAPKHQQKAIDFIFFQIEQKRWEGFISLITFYQVLYFIDKKLGNPRNAAKRAYGYLKVLQLTPFNPALLLQLDVDSWPDYEDGLQYVCAQSGACEVIITTNIHDFFASELLALDPLNFVVQHMDWD